MNNLRNCFIVVSLKHTACVVPLGIEGWLFLCLDNIKDLVRVVLEASWLDARKQYAGVTKKILSV